MPENNADKEKKDRNGQTRAVRTTRRTAAKTAPAQAPEEAVKKDAENAVPPAAAEKEEKEWHRKLWEWWKQEDW